MLVNEVALGKVKVTILKLIVTREASKKPFRMMMNNTIYHSLYETGYGIFPPFLSGPSSPLAHLYSWVERGSVTVKCFSKVNSTIVLTRIRTLTMWLWVWYLNVNRRASMFDPKGRGVGSQLRCFYWSIRCDVQSTSNNRCNWCFVVPQEFKTFAMDLTSPPPGYSSCHGVRNTDNEPSDFKVGCVRI